MTLHIQRDKNPVLFFSNAEKKRILEAVQKAERVTSGEIRVHLERKAREPFYEHAQEVFEKLGMTKTAERNGVLIFINLAGGQFAILGDRGINEKVPENFWQSIAAQMQGHFKEDRFADGIVLAVLAAGEKLHHYFPFERTDINELSNDISYSL